MNLSMADGAFSDSEWNDVDDDPADLVEGEIELPDAIEESSPELLCGGQGNDTLFGEAQRDRLAGDVVTPLAA